MDGLDIFHGPNAGYVLDLYERYQRDPDSVDAQTRALFAALPGPITGNAVPAEAGGFAPTSAPWTIDAIRNAARLARNIRARGHMAARLDPLGLQPRGAPGISPGSYSLSADELAALPANVISGPAAHGAANALDAINALSTIYEDTTGYDYSHVQSAEERIWLRDAVETRRFHAPMSAEEKRALLGRLTEVEAFERFLHQAFPGQKRFSIEGTDMLVPMLDEILMGAMKRGTGDVVMGMAHRGRLNVLAHVLGKPYERLIAEFREAAVGMGPAPTEGINRGWTGDVKYHLGATHSQSGGDRRRLTLTLASNPSHLEFIDPVIEGMTRAAQDVRDRSGVPGQMVGKALPILIHGDAAFPGEGVVAETLNLSRLAGYRTGGTIHIILNNGLGFTTEPTDARSTLYASDLAKGFEIPIIHVNADDAAACIAATRLADAYRETFHKDILIDLVGYRRWGHNEGDEPAFTQPRLYEQISSHPTVRALWAATLEQDGFVPRHEADAMMDSAVGRLRELNRAVASTAPTLNGEGIASDPDSAPPVETAVPEETLATFNEALLTWPGGFAPNAKLMRQLERRRTALVPGGSIDWAHAETLALASILAEGTPIRMTGQDTERGTFSQRHLVLHDASTGATLTPLQVLPQARASFAIYNSPLSEAGALGFEYGYSVQASDTFVLWEAQFGDFANAGQVIIDQFIASAQAKWRQRPSLALLLPHGYEGQGPEHSNARLERFLQLAAQDNLRIVNPTTSAQYFHLLRRQAALLGHDPRPLIVMTPKSLLRHAQSSSRLEDLAQGRFQPVIDDPDVRDGRDSVSRLILCSGKVYVDLVGSKQRSEVTSVAVARVEQIYPFPEGELAEVISRYPNLREVVWLQEEPQNMGAWSFIAPRLHALVDPDTALTYIGRSKRASPAVGSARLHASEQAQIVQDAFAGVRSLQRTP